MKFTQLLAGLALISLVALTGCDSGKDAKPGDKPAGKGAAKSDDAHEHAPHGGVLVEWGAEEYHVEFVVDRAKGEATCYVLGGDAKTPTPIEAEKLTLIVKEPALTLDMLAEPQKDDPKGKSSKFVVKNDAFAKDAKLSGVVKGLVGKTPYEGDFKQEK